MDTRTTLSSSIRLRALAIAILGIIQFAGTDPTAAEKIVVGYAQGPGLWPIWVTEEAGYFKQNGLEVEFVFTSGSEITMAALIGGNLFLSAGGSAAGISAAATGASVVLIGRCGRPPSSLYTFGPNGAHRKRPQGQDCHVGRVAERQHSAENHTTERRDEIR